MLQIKNLNVYHKKDLHPLTKDLSFVLNDGDKAAIIGEEGNGKSTLLRLILGDETVEEYIEWTGEILRDGMTLGYLAQEAPKGRSQSIYEFCCESPAFLEAAPKELGDTAAQLGFSPELFYDMRPVGTLSGGRSLPKHRSARMQTLHVCIFVLPIIDI